MIWGCSKGAGAGAGRHYTVSFAVPGSVIDNTQTMEAATLVAGQIARAAAIFNIDEVVVIDDSEAARCALSALFVFARPV